MWRLQAEKRKDDNLKAYSSVEVLKSLGGLRGNSVLHILCKRA
jgi:hypothetical protein